MNKVNRIIGRIAALIIIIHGSTAFAQEQTSRRALVEELLKVTKAKEMYAKQHAAMMKQLGADLKQHAKASGQTNNTSQAMEWADKEMSWDKVKEQQIKLYEETYTEDELKLLIKYYKAPLSQAFRNPEGSKKIVDLMQKQVKKAQDMAAQANQSNSPPPVTTSNER